MQQTSRFGRRTIGGRPRIIVGNLQDCLGTSFVDGIPGLSVPHGYSIIAHNLVHIRCQTGDQRHDGSSHHLSTQDPLQALSSTCRALFQVTDWSRSSPGSHFGNVDREETTSSRRPKANLMLQLGARLFVSETLTLRYFFPPYKL